MGAWDVFCRIHGKFCPWLLRVLWKPVNHEGREREGGRKERKERERKEEKKDGTESETHVYWDYHVFQESGNQRLFTPRNRKWKIWISRVDRGRDMGSLVQAGNKWSRAGGVEHLTIVSKWSWRKAKPEPAYHWTLWGKPLLRQWWLPPMSLAVWRQEIHMSPLKLCQAAVWLRTATVPGSCSKLLA